VPTFIESGYNVEVNAWYGLLTTGKTSRPVVERLSSELKQVLAEPAVRAALLKHGLDPQPTTADEFGALIAAEIAKWSKLVREAGIPQE
jgi:tripartite-type tricarboxylate transporter receptor subunit TctC